MIGDNKDNIIVGRENEIAELKKAFDYVCEDNMYVINVTGEPGSGKTYLVDCCKNYFVNNGATYINVKFNQYSMNDFTTMINIVDDVIKRILILPSSSFGAVKKELNDKLDVEGEILYSLSDFAKKIFVPKKSKNSIDISSDGNSMVDAVFKFIKITSKIFFPLVLFIDDMQWADEVSLKCIKKITSSKRHNMLLILAYRDSAVKSEELNDLSNSAIVANRLYSIHIKDYLNKKYKKLKGASYLATFIESVSLGNAFYFAILMDELQRKEIVFWSETDDSFFIDNDKLSALNIYGHMENSILDKIRGLEEKHLLIMEILLAFGGKANMDIMIKASGFDFDEFQILISGLKQFIIIDSDNNTNETYLKFIHDIIHDLVHSIQVDYERTKLCITLIDNLEKSCSEEYLLKNHYNITPLLLQTKEEIVKVNYKIWKEVLFKSAIEARNKQAFDFSIEIFELCEIISVSDLEFNLHLQLEFMTCEFISEKEKKAKERYDRLCNKYSNKDDLLLIKLRYMYFYSYSANWESVLLQGEEILSLLGFSFNTNYLSFGIIKSILLYSNRNIRKIIEKKQITDKRILKILEVLIIMFPAANRINDKVFNLINIKIANLSIKHGDSKYSAIGYSAFAYILIFLFGNVKKGDFLQKTTLKILDNKYSICLKSIPYALIGTFTYHWTNSYEDTLEILSKSIEYGEDENEYLYSNYAIVFSIITIYVSGCSLNDVEKHIQKYKSRKRRLENYLTRQMYNVYTSHISYLRTGKANYKTKLEQGKQAFFETIDLNAKMLEVHSLYLEAEYEMGYELARKIENEVWKRAGFALNETFNFYSALNRIKHHKNLCGTEKRENQKSIIKILRRMKLWRNSENKVHLARYTIAKCEYDNEIKGIETFKGYHKALDYVGNNIQLEALCNLILARHYLKENIKLGKFFASESVSLYDMWGATYISKKIEAEFGIEKASEIHKIDMYENKVDIKSNISHLSSIEMMDGNEAWIYFLEILEKQFTITHAVIVFEQNSEMLIYYQNSIENKALEEPLNMNYTDDLPHSLIRYTQRFEKTIIIKDLLDYEFLFDENYLAKIKSHDLYCVPIKSKNVLIGVLYFEKEKSKSFSKLDLKDILSLLNYIVTKSDVPNQKNNEVFENLTKREIEVLTLVDEGKSNIQISNQLFISSGTVRNHLSSIYSKLGVQSRIQAVVKAKEIGLI